MKKIIYYIIIGVAAVLAASCERYLNWNEEVPVEEISGQGLTLHFTCGDLATRADADTVLGVSNENLVKRIDYFFFPCNAEGVVANDAVCAYRGELVPGEGEGLARTYTADRINTGVLTQIFPNGATKAVVFAVANFVDYYGAAVDEPNTTIPDDLTWSELQALQVGESFFKDGGEGFELRWPRVMQPSDNKLFFVMVGKEVVELKHTGSYAVDATVKLERLASKVTVKFTYEPYIIDDKGVKWIPQNEDEETRVYLSNGIEHTTLGGPLNRPLVADAWKTCTKPQVHNGVVGDGTRDIFEYAYDFMNDITTVDETGNKIAHYYTYPLSMEEGDDNQPYLKLVLPWYGYNPLPEGGYSSEPAKQKEVYYKIVLPRETIKDPNMIYEFNVHVNIIGSDKEVMVTGEKYKVKGWSSDEAISSNLATGRYISLDIPKEKYDMYTEKVQILFVSSGEVMISDLKIDQEDFYAGTVNHFITGVNANGTFQYGSGYNANTQDAATPTPNRLSNWVTIEGQNLVVNHQMNNDFSASKFDVAPMTFTITLHLKDLPVTDTKFDRTVTITQYPALYVTREDHVGRVFVNNRTNTSNSSTQYVQAQDDNGGNLGSIQSQVNLGTGANTNPNNYNVYVSTLSGFSQPWVIGDPRDESGTISGLGVTRYRKSSSSASSAIAPSFKIASSYGKILQNVPTFNEATSRCAAYQENGYPAGRWRVPTEAEIEFCVELSNKQMIPSLFNYSYWASSGRYYNYQTGWQTPGVGGNGNTAAVRCVYDIWFWGEDKSAECSADSGATYNQWGGYQD